ncbi:MAG: hypothetical protein H5U03_06000, partial [Clostridia bacterium]|nr:hypothetical protein [Clostridia bacterium]
LSLDQALSALKDPDKYITYPNFAFQLIAKVLEEEDDELFEALAETAEENNDKNKEELPDWLAGDET